MPDIIIASCVEADALAIDPDANIGAVIVIVGENDRACDGSHLIGHSTWLDFDDVPQNPHDKSESDFKSTVGGPTHNHIRHLQKFAEKIRDISGNVLIHCGGGHRRSPAVALVCLAIWDGPGKESESVKTLFEIKPSASPMRTLIELADKMLNREGKLLAALDARISND